MIVIRSALGALAGVCAFAAAAGAQPLRQHDQRDPLFVSPMGEPFRGEAGQGEPGPAPMRAWFAGADADGDRRLSRAEFVADGARFFANVLDANHDRTATSLESTALWRAQAPEMLAARSSPVAQTHADELNPRDPRARERRPQAPPPATQPRPFALGGELEPVMSCDADMSRRVDIDEFEACAARRFVALDTNQDRYFTLDESDRVRELAEARRP